MPSGVGCPHPTPSVHENCQVRAPDSTIEYWHSSSAINLNQATPVVRWIYSVVFNVGGRCPEAVPKGCSGRSWRRPCRRCDLPADLEVQAAQQLRVTVGSHVWQAKRKTRQNDELMRQPLLVCPHCRRLKCRARNMTSPLPLSFRRRGVPSGRVRMLWAVRLRRILICTIPGAGGVRRWRVRCTRRHRLIYVCLELLRATA